MRVTKVFKWEMAHKLSHSYTEKCQHIHGHSYRAEITLQAKELNEDCVVVDFSQIKRVISPIIDSFDHSFMYFGGDTHILAILPSLQKNKRRLIECNFEPTAEIIAQFLFDKLSDDDLTNKLEVVSVRVWETATCCAEAIERKWSPIHFTFQNC